MHIRIDNNIMNASDLRVEARGVIPEIAALKGIRVSYQKDAEGNITKTIDAIRYDCVDPETFANFTIKVAATRPIITRELLDASQDAVYVQIPLDDVLIKPYAIEFGRAKVSITAPNLKIVEN